MLFRFTQKRLFSFTLRVWNEAPKTPLKISSVPEGTPLNLNIKKGSDPVALKDEEYPSWLWTLLDEKKQAEELKAESPVKFARKEMRKRNVAKIKQNNFLSKM